MTNTTAIKSVIATLNAMDPSDDFHELWEKAHDAAEDLLLALEHEDEPEADEHIVRLANATMTANQIAFYQREARS